MVPVEITVRFCWTFEALAEATRWQLRASGRRQRAWIGLGVLLALGGGLLAAAAIVGPPAGYFPGLFVTALAVFVWWVGPGSLTRRLRRQHEASGIRDAEIEWRITETEAHIRDPHGSADLSWGAFVKCVYTPAGLMLYLQPDLFHWLPRGGFDGEADYEALAALTRQQIADYRELT